MTEQFAPGEVVSQYADLDGDGVIETLLIDTDGDDAADVQLHDLDLDGRADAVVADLDQDSVADTVAILDGASAADEQGTTGDAGPYPTYERELTS